MKKPRKQSLADIVKALPPLKKVEAGTKLPHVFDLFWDAKIGSDLDIWLKTDEDIAKARQFLGETGFDATAWHLAFLERRRAHQIYERKYVSDFFVEAMELFPEYNTDQADEAADYIIGLIEDRLLNNAEPEMSGECRTELFESIYAGLT